MTHRSVDNDIDVAGLQTNDDDDKTKKGHIKRLDSMVWLLSSFCRFCCSDGSVRRRRRKPGPSLTTPSREMSSSPPSPLSTAPLSAPTPPRRLEAATWSRTRAGKWELEVTPIPPKSTSSRFRLRACTSNTKQRRRQRRSTFERRSRSNNVRLRPLQELFSSTLHGLEKVEKTADHLILLTPPLSLCFFSNALSVFPNTTLLASEATFISRWESRNVFTATTTAAAEATGTTSRCCWNKTLKSLQK